MRKGIAAGYGLGCLGLEVACGGGRSGDCGHQRDDLHASCATIMGRSPNSEKERTETARQERTNSEQGKNNVSIERFIQSMPLTRPKHGGFSVRRAKGVQLGCRQCLKSPHRLTFDLHWLCECLLYPLSLLGAGIAAYRGDGLTEKAPQDHRHTTQPSVKL